MGFNRVKERDDYFLFMDKISSKEKTTFSEQMKSIEQIMDYLEGIYMRGKTEGLKERIEILKK